MLDPGTPDPGMPPPPPPGFMPGTAAPVPQAAAPPPPPGFVPASTPAAPTTTPTAAAGVSGSGSTPPPATLWQSLKDHTKAFIASQIDPNNKDAIPLAGPLERAPVIGDAVGAFRRGAIKGALGTVAGLTHIGAKLVNDFGIDGDVDAYQKQNPTATLLQARQAVAPEIYGKIDGPAPGVIDSIRGTTHNDQPDFQTDSHKARVQSFQQTAQWFTDHADTQGFWEGLGSGGESIAELLGGEGLLKLIPDAAAPGEAGKVLGIADKLKATERVASFLKANPKIEKLLAIGMRTAHTVADAGVTRAAVDAGVQTGAQTFVKSGGDVDQTLEGAALGATGGAVLHGVLAGTGRLVNHLAPKVEQIAGREVPILRSQITTTAADGTPVRPSALQEIAAGRGDSPAITGQQEAAAAGTVTQEARTVLQREFADANASRAGQAAKAPAEGIPGESAAAAPATAASPAESGIAAGQPEPIPVAGTRIAGRLGEGETGLATQPRVSVEDTSPPGLGTGQAEMSASPIEPQPGTTGTPAAPTPQLGTGQPFRLPQIDVKSAIDSTHDFGDAAAHLKAEGTNVYDRLNQVTGGQWQPLDQRIGALQSKYWKAVGTERTAIETELQSANAQMEKLFNHPNTGVSPADLASAKRMYRSSYLLTDLHNALEPAYQIDADFARETGKYRGFNGGLALSRFRSAIRRQPDIKGLLGPQSSNNLQDIFHYNTSMAGRKRFGEGVSQVARWVSDRGGFGIGALGTGVGALLGGKEGAAIGGTASEASYQAVKYVLHKVATDPQVGRNLLFAIEGGARPENYAPLIGRMLVRSGQKYALPAMSGAIVRSTTQPAQTETSPEN